VWGIAIVRFDGSVEFRNKYMLIIENIDQGRCNKCQSLGWKSEQSMLPDDMMMTGNINIHV